MADRTSEVTDDAAGRLAPGDPAAPENATDERTPAEIQRDIERTRAEMSETVDAIQERFSAGYIKDQMKESIRTSARDWSDAMIETIKENPVPALIAGLSIGWLFRKASRRDTAYEMDRPGYRGVEYYRARNYAYGDRYGDRYYRDQPYGERYYGDRYGEEHPSMRERAGETAESLRERASDVADTVRERASDVAGSVREGFDTLGHRAADMGDTVHYQARRARSNADRMMRENPMAMGAVALAAGAVVGMMVPGTRIEDEWMGETRDQIVDQARETAQETMQKVEQVARKTAEQTKETVKETVRQEARSQGLGTGV